MDLEIGMLFPLNSSFLLVKRVFSAYASYFQICIFEGKQESYKIECTSYLGTFPSWRSRGTSESRFSLKEKQFTNRCFLAQLFIPIVSWQHPASSNGLCLWEDRVTPFVCSRERGHRLKQWGSTCHCSNLCPLSLTQINGVTPSSHRDRPFDDTIWSPLKAFYTFPSAFAIVGTKLLHCFKYRR